MKRVGEDLQHPHRAGAHATQEEQMHAAEQQAGAAEREPDHGDVVHHPL
jgi:hypothetical protein